MYSSGISEAEKLRGLKSMLPHPLFPHEVNNLVQSADEMSQVSPKHSKFHTVKKKKEREKKKDRALLHNVFIHEARFVEIRNDKFLKITPSHTHRHTCRMKMVSLKWEFELMNNLQNHEKLTFLTDVKWNVLQTLASCQAVIRQCCTHFDVEYWDGLFGFAVVTCYTIHSLRNIL